MGSDLIKLARPGQWIKNGVILAALVFAGDLRNVTKLEQALLATWLF
jgi:decaprenyl-phosphate phosphoribosyltransferase